MARASFQAAPGPGSPLANIARAVRRTFDWQGRATRAEYWWYQLGYLAVISAASMLDIFFIDSMIESTGFGLHIWVENIRAYPLSTTVELAQLPTFMALVARRNHDRDKPAWPAWIMVSTALLYFYEPAWEGLRLEVLEGSVSVAELLEAQLANILFYGTAFSVLIYSIWIGVRGSDGANRYGPNPYEGRQADVFA